MGSRDSSTSVMVDASSGEDNALVIFTSALAKVASVYFQSNDFVLCIDILNQLRQKKEDDIKVLHNIAVAEYIKDGCSDPKKFLKTLYDLKNRSEEIVHASEQQAEAVSNVGNIPSPGPKGSNMVAPSSSGVYKDELNTSVAKLNIAVVWFYLHEYAKALSVLEPLYQNIDLVEETTKLHICLLLLDVVLACGDVSKSAVVLSYLEKAFGVACESQGDNLSTTQQQSANMVSKHSSVLSSSLSTNASNLDLDMSINASEISLSRTLSDETLEYNNVLSEIGGENPARSAGVSLSRDGGDKSVSTTELKLKLHISKIRFLLLSRNLKLAKREVKQAMHIARGRDSSMVLVLKSQLEFASENYSKAIKLLMASSNKTDAGSSSILNNNLGCIYFRLGEYHTSSVLFLKALSNCSLLRKEKPLKQSSISQDKSVLISYNCGLLYLARGNPILAAHCLQKARLVFNKHPLFWLRLAECCLMALQKGLLVDSQSFLDKSDVIIRVVGKGKWRELVIEDSYSRDKRVYAALKGGSDLGTEGCPKLSLSLGRRCLVKALHLLSGGFNSNTLESKSHSTSFLDEHESSEATLNLRDLHSNGSNLSSMLIGIGQVNVNGDLNNKMGGISHEIIRNSLSSYERIRERQNHLIKQALLANLAYVELELGNPFNAYSTAKSLLQLPNCLQIYVFLGHVYAAEALCLLNKPQEATQHLSVYISGGGDIEIPFSQEDLKQCSADTNFDSEDLPNISSQEFVFVNPEEARGTLYANLAVLYALQGDLERANNLASEALSLAPNYPQAVMTAVYVDLKLGKSEEAVAKLKQSRRVKFLKHGLRVDNYC